MIGLVMAGGKGSRMEFPTPEKLLLEYEKPVIFNVIDALNHSHCFSRVVAATSPNSPHTKYVLEEYDIERKFRETKLYQIAPISTNLILSYISEHVLGLPRSY